MATKEPGPDTALIERLCEVMTSTSAGDLIETLPEWRRKNKLSTAAFVDLVNSPLFRKRYKDYVYALGFLPRARLLLDARFDKAMAGSEDAQKSIFENYLEEGRKKQVDESEALARQQAGQLVVNIFKDAFGNGEKQKSAEPIEVKATVSGVAGRDAGEVGDDEDVRGDPAT